ncbi:hypothetical protein [Azospirillum thermophilum]|uniref:Uncharacterized protein n=1 Tax=Azospirillum thermophilum TaxID=2202148 RepID=A0A2S2CN59_9PROT|nr:hypothetical protein [Azospirillum thermophilum]AWK85922.1 hypothetical protein DEW08_06290 [Azospirillum thermophilum]
MTTSRAQTTATTAATQSDARTGAAAGADPADGVPAAAATGGQQAPRATPPSAPCQPAAVQHPLAAEAAVKPKQQICCHCGKPVRPGEPHWAGDLENRPWHYGCAEKAGLTMPWFLMRQRGRPASGLTKRNRRD